MPKLLITGKHSFIGESVAAYLRARGGFALEFLDMHGDAWRTFDLSPYDCVLHVAGFAHVSPDPSLAETYRRVNFELAADTAKRAKACGVPQFIFLSSIIVFGSAAPVGVRKTIDASTAPAPANAYGQSKLDAENAILALEDDSFHAAVLRLPMVYGQGCKGNYQTLAKLARRLPAFPDFENHRSMLYIDNLAECIRQIALCGARGIFHPQDAEARSVAQIVAAICAAHGKRMRFSKCLNPFVRLFARVQIVRRAFGDMAYAPAMSRFPFEYHVCDFQTAIQKTEDGGSAWKA